METNWKTLNWLIAYSDTKIKKIKCFMVAMSPPSYRTPVKTKHKRKMPTTIIWKCLYLHNWIACYKNCNFSLFAHTINKKNSILKVNGGDNTPLHHNWFIYARNDKKIPSWLWAKTNPMAYSYQSVHEGKNKRAITKLYYAPSKFHFMYQKSKLQHGSGGSLVLKAHPTLSID